MSIKMQTMQKYFYLLADSLFDKLKSDEVLLVNFSGEDSDFIRFNKSRVRQPGHVAQGYFSLELIRKRRHAKAVLTIQNNKTDDLAGLESSLKRLRSRLEDLPDDPHLLYSIQVKSGEQIRENKLPESGSVVEEFLSAGSGKDMVGIYTQGGIHSGFANSMGQKNWFSSYSFHLNWSFYHEKDKAVKSSYAGFEWSSDEFNRKVESAAEQLEILARSPKTISPGEYRVYLAPSALGGVAEMFYWGGFSLKAHRTKTTPFLKMVEEDATLSPAVTITENTEEGIAPDFQGQGYIRPGKISLIEKGKYAGCLVSPRSGKEYGVEPDGATSDESPISFDMAAGDIPSSEILSRLDTGVYVNQTWYLNYSDMPACRMTGMTRFATFWVENGKIKAPLNVMRFDETAYRILGSNLIGLTKEREFLPDPGTYGARSTGSMRLPGAMIKDFAFTL